MLLHDPKVLLLDEPASGLDPRARIEIRELLKELHRMGKTILISSHILLELADFCNKIGIVERGQMLFTGTVRDILEKARVGLVVNLVVSDAGSKGVVGSPAVPAGALELVQKVRGVLKAEAVGGVIRASLDTQTGDPAELAAALVAQGFWLHRLDEERVNLETAFMRLTKGLVQ